jgi:hypothetical protein
MLQNIKPDHAVDLTTAPTASFFRAMLALLLLSNFSFCGTIGVRGWFDVASR